MTRTIIIAGLFAVALGLFLSKRPDQSCLGLHDEDGVDPSPPSLDGAPAAISFLVQPDKLFLRHAGEIAL